MQGLDKKQSLKYIDNTGKLQIFTNKLKNYGFIMENLTFKSILLYIPTNKKFL